jgi:hypothetical protein
MIARAEGNARAAKMAKLREQGLSWEVIGERYGITGQAARVTVLRHHRVLPPSARPWWRPDADLLAIAHAIRREIEAAEGFRRPPV